MTVLIPNERGLDNALEVRDRFSEVNLFLSASETHNRKNVNRSIEESLAGLERVIARAREEDLRCEGVISVAFGCPYEGEVPPSAFAIARRLRDAGCEEIAFGDTTGMANPAQVRRFFGAQAELAAWSSRRTSTTRAARGWPTWWLRSTRACGSFESSFGELGGCPVPTGATGNIASEDLVSMLHEMGYETGIDLERLVACAREAQRCSGARSAATCSRRARWSGHPERGSIRSEARPAHGDGDDGVDAHRRGGRERLGSRARRSKRQAGARPTARSTSREEACRPPRSASSAAGAPSAFSWARSCSRWCC